MMIIIHVIYTWQAGLKIEMELMTGSKLVPCASVPTSTVELVVLHTGIWANMGIFQKEPRHTWWKQIHSNSVYSNWTAQKMWAEAARCLKKNVYKHFTTWLF